MTITSSLVSGNIALLDGGGIYGDPTVVNSTITGNTAIDGDPKAGGISGNATLTNSIVALNYNGDIDSYTGTNNIIGFDPGFVVAPVFDEDGVLINADEIDLSLTAGSHAINAGVNGAVETEFDVAGNPRIVDGVVDIGAYEYVGSGTLNPPTILTGSGGCYASYGLNRHQITWTAVEEAIGYELSYSADGGRTWNSVETTETSLVISGLEYGADVIYQVRAFGTDEADGSTWSGAKSFSVCPMDVNGDGEISLADRAIVSGAWLADRSDAEYLAAADINGDGEVSLADRLFLAANWLAETGDAELIYPRAALAADAAFAEYASADPDIDGDLF